MKNLLIGLFNKLNEDLNQTIVMVSHEDWHIQYFCKGIYLKDGSIERIEKCEKERG